MNNKYPTTKPSLNLDFANTKSLDPRITFRRGTPGTYYDGVTHVKAEENLLLNSEDFSQWGYGRIVQTSGQSAPDGSSGAYKIEQASGQTSSGYLLQTYNTSANKSYTFSVYAKAGTSRNYVVLRTYLSNNRFTYFDLANGVVDNVNERHSASISDAGNGWYRCSITYTPISTSNVQFNVYFSDNNSSITVADDGGFIYLWGAQLEQRDTVTSYTATNGTPITKYQPKLMTAAADHARFDHDPLTGESKGLLIEEQRTNLLTYSQDFSTSAWLKSDADISLNQIIAPDGTLTGSKLIESSELTDHYIYGAYSTLSGESTYSVYAKQASGSRYIQLRPYGLGSGVAYANFDVTNGVVVGGGTGGSEFVSAEIVDVGNDWYRCIMTVNYSGSPGKIILSLSNGSGELPAYNGDGYSGVYIWGAQVEAGSFATSYIKTTGAPAGTVRSADNASITGENFSSWYRQDEGSFEIDASLLSSSTTQTGRFITISDGSAGNRIQIDNNNATLNFYIGTRSAQQGLYAWDRDAVLDYKFAFGLKKDDVAFCKNNESVAIDSSVELFEANRLDIKDESSSLEQLNGHIKKLAYYPQRLTNEQLQNLTK